MAEFKIGRLRYTWKGTWQTATFYNRDAIVFYNGRTYVCLVPHTSDNFYDDAEHYDPVAGSTPYWTIMLEGNEWKGNWAPNTDYTLGNIVLYTGSLYICTTNHTSGPTTISLGNWDIYVTINSTWAGNYATDQLYHVGEIVKYNGITYRCIEEYTSSTTTIDISKWEIVNVGIEYKSAWSGSAVAYRKNDIVKFGPNLWIATQDHTSSLPFSETVWDMWIPGIEYGTTWSASVVYQIGEVVKYGGYSYTNKVSNNLNIVPSVNAYDSTSAWELLTTGYQVANDWDTGVSYRVGAVVRHSGNAFVAIKDNSNQIPTGTELSKTYAAAGSSGTTLKLNNTTNLAPGMLVSGLGFGKGQFITKVVDVTTIQLNQAPYSTITNGTVLTFTGVDSENWELISAGFNWKNRWESSVTYIVGDVVVWKNATYRCINTHVSGVGTRPDTDTTNSYWVTYFNHDQYNVLNQPGDIVVNTDGINEALSIGSEGFLLKSVSGVPTWSNVFQTPAVYYVTPAGTDATTSGDTWDNPFGSIKYACSQIAQGILNPNFKVLINSNKQFIIEEISNWVQYQISHGNTPFSIEDNINNSKVKRDTSFLIDAILYDAIRGGNSQVVAFVYAYFDKEYSNQYSTPEVAQLMPQFIVTISQTFTILTSVLTNTPVTTSYQILNNAATPITQVFGPTVETQALVDITSYQTIILNALIEGNTSNIPPENQGMSATLMVKTGTYYESLPIVIPANTALVGDELRGAVVRPKVVIDTIAIRTQSNINLITVKSTEGLVDSLPVQFASINPAAETNTVFGGLESGTTYYVIGSSITNTKFAVSTSIGGPPVILTNYVSQMHVYGGDALSNMFLVQNGTGIRNMTLTGLLGTLTDNNEFETRRPTGGAFVSLDPGQGPDDTSAWIYRKSPYMQNVTTFGVGAIGLKIDGNLHNGGYKSAVCNDFTQIISDGIGVWCTGPDALCEAVSVFTYYNYSGYFAEAGGRIRATNGNSSYGTYGVVAEGFNVTETPISGTVYNRYYEATATPLSSLGANAEILKLQYSHAGENYFSEITNLLQYSNLFTSWSTDSNITLIQSIVSPSGLSNGWVATGNTSGTDSSYIYQNITVAPSGATYTALSADIQTGNGIGATFDVIVTSTEYIVSVNNPGSGYVVSNQLQINGSQLGGIDGVNDLIITVASLINGTQISTINKIGTVQVGSVQYYTASVFCKKGTSELFDVTATFSGYSSVMSGISFNFSTEDIIPIAANGGFAPTNISVTPQSNQPGWYRISFQFYDTTALNNVLQIRIYPRSRLGNSAYTMIYGAQLEIGNELGFYLATTSNRVSSHANFEVTGAGSGVVLVGNELRSNSVFQTRVLEVDGNTGGTNYLISSNNAQSGNETSITIAQSDVANEKDYLGMRIFINSGAGAGQYGRISSFDAMTKNINVLKESFDLVTVITSEAATDTLALSNDVDINTLYVNQLIQFIPTSYVTPITNVSQKSIAVTETIGGIINTISVTSTARLAVNMPITFSGDQGGGLTTDFTYYVLQIIDDTTIQVSLTIGGAAILLNTDTPTLTLNYPSNTSHLVGDTTHMSVNLPIYFTGNVFSDIVAGQTYYISEIYAGSTFTISPSLAIVSATATTAISNQITVDDTSALKSITPIVFTGTTFGNIGVNVKYYINHIVDLTHISITPTVIDITASSTLNSSDLVTVNDTTGLIIGNPVIFSGTTFGGIVNEKVYYVHYVNNSTTFSISTTSVPRTISATQTFVTSNNITVNDSSNLMLLNPIVFSGTTFGNIVSGTEYYINKIVNSTTIRVSSSIISVEATETEATSNLITVGSTAGFVADHPIIFGGPSIGGLVSGTVYYISAVNNDVTFTVSSAVGGAAVNLSTDTGLMTARTPSSSFNLANASGTMTGTSRYTGTAVNLSTGVGECEVRTTGQAITLTTASGSLVGTSTVEKESLTAGTGSMSGTFSVPLFAGINNTSTYYVKTIVPGTPNKFTISESIGGATVALTEDFGSMQVGEVGWDHVNPGTPPVSIFDSTTVYSIEPLVTYSRPAFDIESNTSAIAQAPGTSYISIEYGNHNFVALPNGGLSLSVSINGQTWTQQQLPSAASWKDLSYGNKYWVIISSGGSGIPGSKVLYSNSNLVTWKTSYLPSIGNWSKIVYGNGKFVVIGGSASAVSINFGTTWTGGTINADTWVDVAYGIGTFVAISPTNSKAAYSADGINWAVVNLPRATSWSSIKFGNGRFVAISSAGGKAAYSFDGINWYDSTYPATGTHLEYGNGVFLASQDSGATGYLSEDGVVWFVKAVPDNMGISAFGFNNVNKGAFIGISGQNSVGIVYAGSRTKARPEIYQEKIVRLNEWEPGSNYSGVPTVSIIDTNATKAASVSPLLSNGVLGNPTFYNRGSGYNTTSTQIYVSGDGYAENFQVGLQLIFDGLTRLPAAGDNLTIANNTTVYKITDAVALDGTTAPSVRALISISPSMSTAKSPNHGTSATIRTKYSQVRLTNHDFLNIGYGNVEQSNYPRLPATTVLSPENEAVESNYGRVFYSSTDQDGNFRVGKLFAVEQATGIVTLSASQFGLEGLSELRLGGIAVGGNSVIITQFSTESTFVANSNSIIPTQKAIKSYLTARLSQGGANTFTGQLIAGTVLIGGPDKIASTIPEGNEGSHVNIPVKVNVNGFEDGGWDGDGMAMAFFMKHIANR